MFKKILVPLDYSDRTRQVLDDAIALAKLTQAEILLFHALSASELDYPAQVRPPLTDVGFDSVLSAEMMQLYVKQLQQFEQEGLKKLQFFARDVEAQGIPVTWTQLFGSAASEICRIASEEHVDLIVMGRRGRSGLKEAFLGSVSNYVMHHAPCTVMISHSKSE